ncbi:M20/M25/M40 family metallo-hydrolase [Jeotgalibacillus sp. ET6]|uniref:M20/M25/M40 family metallo-hydrolase n=1 Tax=Jeotgalibacillus sp. ET6 TaxID=3037260 RepID=UPI002418655C|nr:M20/M25/M40 family metallo-hydrolase [Jeotgalibacillus sp. ET6]MDG5473360.1 M20/M25/M40 family metallo-hydrolase [Jeotgalibacillus sp. ET6]
MYNELKNKSTAGRAEMLTRRLVGIKSYTGSSGEAEKVQEIYSIIQSFPYFQQHPEDVWIQPIDGDPYNRINVWAKLEGRQKKTVLFHSHIDTVETDDFGTLQSLAHDPDALQKYFSTYDGDQRVKEQALSGDWLFGRGSLDMQSGAAIHLTNLLELSEQKEPLDGTMLFLFNPDEESEHAGMLAALQELQRMKEEGLKYVAAINNDFIAPMHDNDDTKYIYTGAAGKVLPSFYIYGREAHVGDVLTSIDPTLVGSEINRKINQNLDLVEELEGEYVLPPACLYFKEDKHSYNVQTAVSARMYFNYFVFEQTAKDVMDKLLSVTRETVEELRIQSERRYDEFRIHHGFPPSKWKWEVGVCTYEDLQNELKEKGLPVDEVLDRVASEWKGKDRREASFALVEALQQLDPDKKPRVILFFAPPFLPHNYLNEQYVYGAEIREKLVRRLEVVAAQSNETFATKRFFPYLADGSYLSLHESEEEVNVLKRNMPRMSDIYPLPIDLIRSVNIPSINIGVYGRDGHKWTERVYKPYTFHVLPSLIKDFALDLVAKKEPETKVSQAH